MPGATLAHQWELSVNGRIDVDELLGDELSEQLDSWDFGAARYLGGSSVDYALNWKFANDVFGENYHFDTLHAEKFDNIFYSDASAFDAYGRNHRLTVASRFVDAMRERPEDQWNVSDAGIVVYYLFPNVQIELFNRIISVFRIYPNRYEVGRCMTRISHYSAPHIGTDVADEVATVVDGATVYNADTTSRIEFTLESLKELIDSTLEEEDYFIGAKSQQTADSRQPNGRGFHFWPQRTGVTPLSRKLPRSTWDATAGGVPRRLNAAINWVAPILTWPPQVSMSMLKTRLGRCAQIMVAHLY